MATSLVIQLARFGDLVQTKRLVASLTSRPGDEVCLVVDHSLRELAKLLYPHVGVYSIQAHGGGHVQDSTFVRKMIASCTELRALDADCVYNLNFSGLNMALSSLFDPGIVRGYRLEQGQWRKDAWAHMGFRLASRRQSSPLNLVDLWAGYARDPIDPAKVNPPATAHGGGIGVVLAGRDPRRSLDTRTLALLTSAALERVGHGPIVLLGTRAESRMARDLQSLLRPAVAREVSDLTGRTHWQGLMEHVQKLDLLLTPDTGTMHLAAHLGVPVMAFFLASAWCHETGPYGKGHVVVQSVQECAPCKEGHRCPHQVCCVASFASRSLLRYVSGRSIRDWPRDLALYASGFDRLGSVFHVLAGDDLARDERAALRELVTIHNHLKTLLDHPASDDLLKRLYREKDWMVHASGTVC
ncbi:glycosyltransferase family 9 protein [Desulfoplanes formicivorans]|uniref:Glycosyl transferase n=1 Tax=Desulfoplanes formicivorans TaxID=1592317 RepID=A0A194AMS5_9BACT|nr:glycosyltransferase family 9 protein [Desulfoplanes formicivorans]GAU09919.1 glycosyl transferase [Desulfoplanes formicivorans]